MFAGKNYYYPPAARRVPDGRLSLRNGTFHLPLQKGANQIAVALSNNFPQGHAHYGWGLLLKLHSPAGLKLAAGR